LSELFSELGIEPKLLIAQGLNFGILLVALTYLVYRPLSRIIEERRKKIELGLKGAEEAQKKIAEAEVIKTEKIKEADQSAVKIIGAAEKKAKKRQAEIMAETDKKAEQALKDATDIAEKRNKEEMDALYRESKSLVKEMLAKTVELSPKAIDDKLVDEAVVAVKKSRI
jgi:F-type H+-transporting ATPase subunit b